MFVTDNRWEVIPRGKGKERQIHESNDDAGQLHMQEFLDAVRHRRPPGCLAADAYASTATVKLAMIAFESGCQIQWDADREQIVGNPEAGQLLRRAYRAPWQHPAGPA